MTRLTTAIAAIATCLLTPSLHAQAMAQTLGQILGQTQAPAEESSKSLLDHVISGGPIGFTIIMISFLLLGLIVFHLIQIRASKMAPPAIVAALDRLLASGDIKGATAYCQDPENDCFLTRVFGSALMRCARSPFGFLELRSALEEAGQEHVSRYYRAVDGIGLIAAVAPMLGLLGTVVGMVGAFETISTTEGFAKPDELAGSISVALITTVLGLIVAIPATAVFTFFRNRIDSLASHVAEVTEDISAHLESSGQSGSQSGGKSGGQSGGQPRGAQPAQRGAPRQGQAPRPGGAPPGKAGAPAPSGAQPQPRPSRTQETPSS
jgi:biopolymer transport protein ExbB